jgi:tetratricopeptide (TPR) repeat protein
MERKTWLTVLATIGATVAVMQIVPQITKSASGDANNGLIALLQGAGKNLLRGVTNVTDGMRGSDTTNYSNSTNSASGSIAPLLSTAEEYVTQGKTKIEQGDYQTALQYFNQAVALDPKLLDAYYNRANLKASKLQDTAGALADCDRTIQIDPQSAWAYSNRGYMRVEYSTNYQGALADYNKAVALDPKYAFAYSSRAYLKSAKLNDIKGALADYNKAIELDPKDAYAYNGRAYLKEHKLKDYQGAVADYSKSITIAPNSADVYTYRGNIKYLYLQDIPGAQADYNKAIKLDPKYADAYSSLAIIQHQSFQNTTAALANFNKAIELQPTAVDSYYNRGDLFYGMDDKQTAISDFQKVVQLNSDEQLKDIANGVINLEKKSFDAAIANFNSAIKLNVQTPDAHKYRGLVYQGQGNKTAARADWLKAAQLYQQFKYTSDYNLVQKWLKNLDSTTTK